jgi:hypothetical protein
MITSEHIYEAGVPKFVGEKESDNLYIVLIPVDIVPLEEIFLVRWWPNLVEKAYKVLQLPVDVSRNYHWRFHFNNDGLLLQLRYY